MFDMPTLIAWLQGIMQQVCTIKTTTATTKTDIEAIQVEIDDMQTKLDCIIALLEKEA